MLMCFYYVNINSSQFKLLLILIIRTEIFKPIFGKKIKASFDASLCCHTNLPITLKTSPLTIFRDHKFLLILLMRKMKFSKRNLQHSSGILYSKHFDMFANGFL